MTTTDALRSGAAMKTAIRIFCGGALMLAAGAVWAAEPANAQTANAHVATTEAAAHAQGDAAPLRARLAHGVAEPTVDMNGYAVNPTVRDELIQSFDEQISQAGLTIVTDGVPTRLVFIDYKERSEVGRLILGGLGGRDHVTVEVHVGETHFLISHSGFGSMNTMDRVAQRVGSDAGVRVARLAGKPTSK